MRTLRNTFLFIFFICLYGCSQQVEINSGLQERDANAVISALAENNISVSKRIDKDGITVLVDYSYMARALRILSIAGLPKAPHDTLGKMFPNDGIISTPLEEQARYIYALSQELEYTLSEIDGVVIARVHVVLPEKVSPGERVMPASASVFIKHQDSLDPDVIKSRIRKLVAGSIPGLISNKDKLSVVFVSVKKKAPSIQMQKFGPFWIDSKKDYIKDIFLTISTITFLTIIIFSLLFLKKKGYILNNKTINIKEFKIIKKS